MMGDDGEMLTREQAILVAVLDERIFHFDQGGYVLEVWGGSASPAETVESLRALRARVVRGEITLFG